MKQNITEMNDILNCVDDFADIMKHVLIKPENMAKGGWREDDPLHLWNALCAEVMELHHALIHHDSEEIIQKEAADVANFAMMIADVYRRNI